MAKETYYKKKKVIETEQETFRDLYFRTVDRLYVNAYTRVLNHDDAMSILIDSYLVMYRNLKELRHAPSLMWWLRKCCNEGYKKSMRSHSLKLVHEVQATDEFPALNESQRYELWHKIIKISDINEYVRVPVPSAAARAAGGFLAPLLSRIKSVSSIEKMRISLIVGGVVTFLAVTVILGVKFIPIFLGGEIIEPQQEIFLPDSAYEGIEIQENQILVDDSQIATAVLQAHDRASYLDALTSVQSTKATKYFDPEWASMPDFGSAPDVASMENMGKISGNQVLTGDEQFDTEILKTIAYILDEDMTDKKKISSIYSFVCHYGTYKQQKKQETDVVMQAKSFFVNGGGDSDDYAAAFKVLCNAAGYPVEMVRGEFIVQNKSGGQKLIEHTWAKVILNGIEYHCDPEADCSADGSQVRTYYLLAARGTPEWEVFLRDHRWKV